jgi:hypothetical protein
MYFALTRGREVQFVLLTRPKAVVNRVGFEVFSPIIIIFLLKNKEKEGLLYSNT